MVDRRINFGDPADSGTRWQMEDDENAAGGGNFVLAKDLDGNTVLLQYNPTSDAFEFVRAVDMGGEDVTGVGGVVGESGTGVYDDATQTVGDGTTSADHESVSTDELTTDRSSLVVPLVPTSVPSGSETVLELSDTAVVNQLTGLDATNNQWVAPNDMTVSLCTTAQWNDPANEPTDDDTVSLSISVNGNKRTEFRSESSIDRFESLASPTVDAEVSQGDTIDVRMTQSTGSTADIASSIGYRNYLRIRRV